MDALRGRTQAKVGTPLDVGAVEDVANALVSDDNGEGREPVELLARILAHIGHRIPFFAKVEKRLEGKDAKSGFASDVVAFITQLWSRNRHLAPVIVAMAQQARQSSPPPRTQDVTDVTGATGSTFHPQQEVS